MNVHCKQKKEITAMLNDEAHPINIPQLIREAPFPVYGLVGNPLELAVCSVSWGSSNTRRTSVGFTYSSPRYPDERDAIEIDSLDAHQSGIVYNPKDASGNPLFDLDAQLFQRYHLSDNVRKQAGSPQVVEGTWTIAQVAFTGEIRHWSQPHQLSRFFLTSQDTWLGGYAFGPSLQDLLQLLQAAVAVNHRDDLLAQYQRELDQETERLFGKRG
jgi:hypothetical protein